MSVITRATEKVKVARPQRKRRGSQLVSALILGGPAFLLLLVFLIGPFFMGVAYSFTDERLISPVPAQYIGAKNYSQLLQVSILTLDPLVDSTTNQLRHDAHGKLLYPPLRTYIQNEQKYPRYFQLEQWFSLDLCNHRYVVLAHDPTFLHSIFNNIFFALVVIPLQTGLGLLLALLVNQKLKGRNFFRTIYFSPVVTSMVVISIVWTFLYDKNVGLMNQMLKTVSFGAFGAVDWLGNPSTAMWAIIIMSVWQGVGLQMILFLAGLQDIPEQLYEAASIDGANGWQQFVSVTVPGLRNVTVFILISITIAAFQLFTQVWVMTQGGPNGATSTVMFDIVQQGFVEQNIGYASAMSVIFFLFIIVIALVQRYATREQKGK
ncbi:MAG TPA: sugar ABC transporter permease [Ktedonobacteraceae bacterium]|nr:sugar ABC transporter permease [Ktedonobacteraceae bacterium]